VQAIVEQRCVPCHSEHPTNPTVSSAPQGIEFDTLAEVKARADAVKSVAVDSTVMPLGNVTRITPAERAALGAWIAAGAPLK
jgi:uncharacterized membrane protein